MGSIWFTMEKPVSIDTMIRNRWFGCQNGFTIRGKNSLLGFEDDKIDLRFWGRNSLLGFSRSYNNYKLDIAFNS